MKRLLMGKHLTDDKLYYWNLQDKVIDYVLHDYAIVESKDGIDLVEVIGACFVKDSCKHGHKKVLKLIDSAELYNE